MADNIVFNDIPIDIRTPGHYIEIDNSRALSGLPGQPRKVLVLGQSLTNNEGAVAPPQNITSSAQAIAQFGRGSQLALSLAAVLDTAPGLDITALALADSAAGVAAVFTLTIAGTATETGTVASQKKPPFFVL